MTIEIFVFGLVFAFVFNIHMSGNQRQTRYEMLRSTKKDGRKVKAILP
jgi:hypothetical protein